MPRLSRRAFVGAGASFVAAAPAIAQGSGTINLVVPFPPGGSTDALARLLQPGLQSRLGGAVIVENRAGAAGAIGAAQVAKGAPDGTSLLVTFDSHAVIPAILEKPPVDVVNDLVPVFLVGTAPYVLAANSQRPYKTIADVIKASKEQPGSVKYASVGIGTIGHLAMTVLAKQAGVQITHVAYRGGGPAMNDVVGGHVDCICGSAALITPQLGGGAIRPVLQMGRERLAILGETQTAIEAGFPGFEAVAWWGMFAPKGTPAAVVDRVATAVKETLAEPASAARLKETQQMTLVLGGPDKLDAFFKAQVDVWGKVVRENGIKAQT